MARLKKGAAQRGTDFRGLQAGQSKGARPIFSIFNRRQSHPNTEMAVCW